MNRGKLDIIASMLNATKEDALGNPIRRKCNLSGKQFNEYVQLLLENGLVDAFPATNMQHIAGPKNKRRTIYHISEYGKRFLKLYSELYSLVDRHVADSFLGKARLLPSAKRFCGMPHNKVIVHEC